MHYHAEVWVPKKLNRGQAKRTLNSILASYHEETDSKNGFYDFYSIGGRWTGAHDSYDPTSNLLNYKNCWLCNGSGKRPGAFQNCAVYPNSRGCNGCSGTGAELKWPTSWVFHEGDIMSVEEAEKLQPKLNVATLIIAPTGKRKRPHIIHEFKWNGKNFEKTGFDGLVFPYLKKKRIKDGYLITLDYHC